MSTVAASRRGKAHPERSVEWRERAGRLYGQLRRPAQAMLRRAFRGAFDDDEIEDVYSNAWLGTLRALERRHEQLSDEEIRKYVLTAVANHASKELRRRSRRPTAPLEAVHAIADDRTLPDERAAKLEESRSHARPPGHPSSPQASGDADAVRLGARASPDLRAGQGPLAPRLSKGDHAGRRRADGEAALARARPVVRRSRARAEGVCGRTGRCRAATPGAAASLALPPLPRVRRQAQRPAPRRRVLDRGVRRGGRDRRRTVLACGPGGRCGPSAPRVGRQCLPGISRRRRRQTSPRESRACRAAPAAREPRVRVSLQSSRGSAPRASSPRRALVAARRRRPAWSPGSSRPISRGARRGRHANRPAVERPLSASPRRPGGDRGGSIER